MQNVHLKQWLHLFKGKSKAGGMVVKQVISTEGPACKVQDGELREAEMAGSKQTIEDDQFCH